MTPTAKFRWLKLPAACDWWDVRTKHPSAVSAADDCMCVLQQWWAVEREGQITPQGEWRDVPIEEQA